MKKEGFYSAPMLVIGLDGKMKVARVRVGK